MGLMESMSCRDMISQPPEKKDARNSLSLDLKYLVRYGRHPRLDGLE